MPELPEVETVKKGLELIFGKRSQIAQIKLMRGDIRSPIPPIIKTVFNDRTIKGVRRRAKYLLIDTDAGILLCHLGMTGTWRLAKIGQERDHDHCYIILKDGRRLAFRDPRRFGLLDFIAPGCEEKHPRLRALGPEPLDVKAFTPSYLFEICRGRKIALKSAIMDQRIVVGVGNIYAQEALFRSRLSPTKRAGRLTLEQAAILVGHIRKVLTEAITAGGSTISDFRQAGGDNGYFQHNFQVYDRQGEPCPNCKTPLHSAVVGGRGTTWCRTCQR